MRHVEQPNHITNFRHNLAQGLRILFYGRHFINDDEIALRLRNANWFARAGSGMAPEMGWEELQKNLEVATLRKQLRRMPSRDFIYFPEGRPGFWKAHRVERQPVGKKFTSERGCINSRGEQVKITINYTLQRDEDIISLTEDRLTFEGKALLHRESFRTNMFIPKTPGETIVEATHEDWYAGNLGGKVTRGSIFNKNGECISSASPDDYLKNLIGRIRRDRPGGITQQ